MIKNDSLYVKMLLISLVAVLFFACNKKPIVDKPERLIEEAKMVDIIYDLSVLQAIKSINPTILEQKKLTPTSYIYTKYNIDSLQFAQNDRYYASDIEVYEEIYEQVHAQLLQKKKEVDTTKRVVK